MAVLVGEHPVAGLRVGARAVVLPAVDERGVGQRDTVGARRLVVGGEGHGEHGVEGRGARVRGDQHVDQVVRGEVHPCVGGPDDVRHQLPVPGLVRRAALHPVLRELQRHPQPALHRGLGAVVEPPVGTPAEPVGGLREELRHPVRRGPAARRVREVDHEVQGPYGAGGRGISGRGRHPLRHLYAQGGGYPARSERGSGGEGHRTGGGPARVGQGGARGGQRGDDQGGRARECERAATAAYPSARVLHGRASGVRGNAADPDCALALSLRRPLADRSSGKPIGGFSGAGG